MIKATQAQTVGVDLSDGPSPKFWIRDVLFCSPCTYKSKIYVFLLRRNNLNSHTHNNVIFTKALLLKKRGTRRGERTWKRHRKKEEREVSREGKREKKSKERGEEEKREGRKGS
jgi:hypothetical protein